MLGDMWGAQPACNYAGFWPHAEIVYIHESILHTPQTLKYRVRQPGFFSGPWRSRPRRSPL